MSEGTVNPYAARAIFYSQQREKDAQATEDESKKREYMIAMRALDKAAVQFAKGVTPFAVGDHIYMIESRTNAGEVYRVDVFERKCNCANAKRCWHLAAAFVCDEIRRGDAPGDIQDTALAEFGDADPGEDPLPQGVRDMLADPRYEDLAALDAAEKALADGWCEDDQLADEDDAGDGSDYAGDYGFTPELYDDDECLVDEDTQADNIPF